MSEEIQVGTTCVTFHVTAFDQPMDIAEARVDVPIYATTGETIGNNEKGLIHAHVQKDFGKKVEHALQVFADTLEASFKRGDDIMTDWVDRVFGRHVEAPYDRAYSSDGMPTKPGWYVTRDGEDLLSYDGDAWHIHSLGGAEPFADGDLETMDWSVVRRTFEADSFPLVPVNPRKPNPPKASDHRRRGISKPGIVHVASHHRQGAGSRCHDAATPPNSKREGTGR